MSLFTGPHYKWIGSDEEMETFEDEVDEVSENKEKGLEQEVIHEVSENDETGLEQEVNVIHEVDEVTANEECSQQKVEAKREEELVETIEVQANGLNTLPFTSTPKKRSTLWSSGLTSEEQFLMNEGGKAQMSTNLAKKFAANKIKGGKEEKQGRSQSK